MKDVLENATCVPTRYVGFVTMLLTFC